LRAGREQRAEPIRSLAAGSWTAPLIVSDENDCTIGDCTFG
jgi:hypothetical protein